MMIKTAVSDLQKVTITLPKAVVTRLNHLVALQRSRFIAETLEERLALEEQLLALDETAGAWSDENHPDMLDDAAIYGWLNTLRSSWSWPGDVDHDRLSVCDTGLVLRHLRGTVCGKLFASCSKSERLFIATVTRLEVHAGMTPDERYATQKLLSRLGVYDLDRTIADKAGDLIAMSKKSGRVLGVPDAIIAATAIGGAP